MYKGMNTVGIIFLLYLYFLRIPIPKSKVYLFLGKPLGNEPSKQAPHAIDKETKVSTSLSWGILNISQPWEV